MLRLGDLLEEDRFTLELLSGGPAATEREVHGAHAVEVESPARCHDLDIAATAASLHVHRNSLRADAQNRDATLDGAWLPARAGHP